MSSKNQSNVGQASNEFIKQKTKIHDKSEMGQFCGTKTGLSEGCDSESRIKCEAEECANMNYSACRETSSQHFYGIESMETFAKVKSGVQNCNQEHLIEQSNNSLTDSNNELFDNDELSADLLPRYHAKFNRGLTVQPTVEDKEGMNGVLENSSPRGCDHKSKSIKHEKEECADMSDIPCVGTSSQHFSDIDSNERFSEETFAMQDVKSDCSCEHSSNDSMNDSNSEASDNEEFADLLQRCYPESSTDIAAQRSNDNKEDVKDNRCQGNKKMPISTVREKSFKCPKCDADFSEKSNLIEHIMSGHNHEKPYECSECDMKFSERRNRNTHWRSEHGGEKPYSCDQCDYKCSWRSYLKRHKRAVHDGVKDYACTQCDYKSSAMSILRRHCKAVHNLQKTHWCTGCGKAFSIASDLMKTNNKEETHPCPECGQPFSIASNRKINNQQKTHPCTECDKVFNAASNLKKHIDSVHKDLKPFSCSECCLRFSSNYKLQIHTRAVHYKEKPYSCFLCSKSFSKMAHVRIHVDAVHNGLKPYQCTQCDKSFSQKPHLNKHMKTLHN